MSEVGPDNCGAPPHPHNRIYQALTSNQEDLVGHIAYSLYKRNKVAYIELIERDYQRPPTTEELKSFQRQACLSYSLDAYRDEAERILSNFTNEILQGSLDDAESSYQAKLIDELKQANPFWRGVWQSILASIGAIIIFTLLFALVWGYKHGFKELIEIVFDLSINKNKS